MITKKYRKVPNKLIIKNRSTILSVNSLLRNGFSSAITPLLGLLAINSTYKGFYALAAIQIAATIILYRFFKKSSLNFSNLMI